MFLYWLKRIGYMFITLLLIISLTFIAMKSLPGDPIAAKYEDVSEEIKDNMRTIYGLDQPEHIQFFTYLKGILQGNLGISIALPGKTANAIIKETSGASIQLGLVSLVISLILGLACGMVSGLKRNSVASYIIYIITVLGISIPNFVLVTLLQYLFSYKISLLPPIGWDSGGNIFTGWHYVILPIIALSLSSLATYIRYTRESIIEIINEDYLLTARAKGLSRWRIISKYIMRNSLLPIITVSAQQVATLLTGSFVIEMAFSIPGIGRYFVDSVMQNDYTIIMAVTIFYSVIFILATLIMDILYYFFDPRMSHIARSESGVA